MEMRRSATFKRHLTRHLFIVTLRDMTDLTIIQKIAVWALPLIFAITLHEVAHGFVAYLLGDYTAKLSGRLTIAVPFLMMMVSSFIFGWAKPVPVDPRNFKNPRRDMALVALAGPVSNLLMALIWGFIAKMGLMAHDNGNDWLGLPLVYMGGAGIMLNVVLAVLNLIPLPPLDGGKVLEAVLPRKGAYYMSLLEPYSFYILILLILTGLLSFILGPPVFLISSAIGELFGL
jgi:Zn-dependent protease